MEERAAVDSAGAVLFQCPVVDLGTVALVYVKSVFGELLSEPDHKTVAHDLGRDRGDGLVSADDGLLVIFYRRLQETIEIDGDTLWFGRESADAARGCSRDR